ncbi:cell division ATP-binding protein FtsE [Marinisporobacter balticus]|uniref:Cell division transport system ATP-binding protein n=1 Tax=Marinisporobacter balticus TaxID=2018667 RepID=A0A4R2KZH9_9FIRM|nr:ATP-binding cassette domain-containing protein [Marinisporobacter balticus]TCO79534.1 cell division transport system ATP-binding protein [Marinisporobacter balticus]
MIEAKDICLKYPDGTMGLQNIDFKIETGEVVYITGPSGSGKTSILKLLMGIEYPTTGSLKVFGQSMTKDKVMEIRRLRMIIGPVFQDFKLLKGRTVIENIILGMRFLGFSKKQMKKNAGSALIKVGLEHKALSLVDNLSLGESQRIAIARALARKPSLIIADEPTGNLDKENALNILELLTLSKDPKTTVIITTHATHLIEDIKEGMRVQMDGGHILCERIGEV